jgi:formylglycine-generating enzyme required for sulfatase activity
VVVAPDAAAPPDLAAATAPADGAAPGDGPAAFENSLGMRFLPVPGTGVMFSIWETRVMDYAAYAQATGAAVPKADFPEAALQPKAAVSRAEAQAFAAWLTGKEQKDGRIPATGKYRLPSDAEWDAAVLLGKTGGPYAWGTAFPPPDHFCNYMITNDGFEFTAPVGSFPANALGLHDLQGNLWEWIGEGCAQGGAFLVRGAGWNAKTASFIELGFHYCFGGDLVGHHNVGFRVVLEGAP